MNISFKNTYFFLLPTILSVFFVLKFTEKSINYMHYNDNLFLITISFLASTALTGLFYYLYRELIKASLTSLIVVTIISYGGLWVVMLKAFLLRGIDNLLLAELAAYTAILGCTFVIITILSLSKFNFSTLMIFLSTMISIIISLTIFNIARYEIEQYEARSYTTAKSDRVAVQLASPRIKRDIYFLVFDRYPAQRTLLKEYDYDNSDFLNLLKNKGFFIAEKSVANYFNTTLSLSSTFSMRYYDQAFLDRSKRLDDSVPYHHLLNENHAATLLKEVGYQYLHMGSWWAPTSTNNQADKNFAVPRLSSFEVNFLSMNIFAPLFNYAGLVPTRAERGQCERVPKKMNRIKQVPSSAKPTFTFAHFLIPHPPWVFNSKGDCITETEIAGKTYNENYIQQLKFVNSEIMKAVDHILENSTTEPIIIIQSDEGPYPPRYRNKSIKFDWHKASDSELQQKSRIINAIYFPGANYQGFKDNMTPINTFRMVFNAYFDANVPLLPNKNYAYPNRQNVYDLFEITEIVQ